MRLVFCILHIAYCYHLCGYYDKWWSNCFWRYSGTIGAAIATAASHFAFAIFMNYIVKNN